MTKEMGNTSLHLTNYSHLSSRNPSFFLRLFLCLFFLTMFNFQRSFAQAEYNPFGSVFESVFEGASDQVNKIIENLGDEIEQLISKFEDSTSRLIQQAEGSANDLLDRAVDEGNVFRARTANEVLVLTQNISALLREDINKGISELKPEFQQALLVLNRAVDIMEELPDDVLKIEDALYMDIRRLAASVPILNAETYYVREIRGINILRNPNQQYMIEIDGIGLGIPSEKINSSISLTLKPEGEAVIPIPMFQRPNDRVTEFMISDDDIAHLFEDKAVTWLPATFSIDYAVITGQSFWKKEEVRNYSVDIRLSLIPRYAGTLTVSYNYPKFEWVRLEELDSVYKRVLGTHYQPRWRAVCMCKNCDGQPTVSPAKDFPSKSEAEEYLATLPRRCEIENRPNLILPEIYAPKYSQHPKRQPGSREIVTLEKRVNGSEEPVEGDKRLTVVGVSCVQGHCDPWFHIDDNGEATYRSLVTEYDTHATTILEVWSQPATWVMYLAVDKYTKKMKVATPETYDVMYGEDIDIDLPQGATVIRMDFTPVFGQPDRLTLKDNSDTNSVLFLKGTENSGDDKTQVLNIEVRNPR